MIPVFETERLLVTVPGIEAAPRALAYALENRAHLDPWEPGRPEGYYTLAWWEKRIPQLQTELVEERGVRFFCYQRPAGVDSPIVAMAALARVERGPTNLAQLGYSVDHRFEGQGLMREALEQAVIPYAFGTLRVHRISAGYAVENQRSAVLLKRLGFTVEGYARDYLFVAGRWHDHVFTGLINPEG